MNRIIISENPEDTKRAGTELSLLLKGDETIALDGDLGVGKTVFVKGLAAGLEINEEILSPTFTILKEYCGRFPLYHFDVYRISDICEMTEVGYYDYIGKGICVIEWSELIRDILPENMIKVNIERISENSRKIEIKMLREK